MGLFTGSGSPHVLAGHSAVCYKEEEGKGGLIWMGLYTTQRATNCPRGCPHPSIHSGGTEETCSHL